jgi:hypothetical protein
MEERTEGEFGIGAMVALGVITVIIVVVVNVANDFSSGGIGGETAADSVCSTKCTWFRAKNCENDRDVGLCMPTWGCGDGFGAHQCENRQSRQAGMQADDWVRDEEMKLTIWEQGR